MSCCYMIEAKCGMAAALADGRITVSEAKRISEEASALIDRLQSLWAALKPKAVA